MQAKKRIVSLDLIRSIAIFLVVLTHASDKSYAYFSLDIIPKLSSIHRIFAVILHILGRSGVPLFLFLTGYLLIDRDYENNKAVDFWKKHLIPLIITSSILGCIYFIYNIIVEKHPLSLSRLLTELFFYQQYEGTQFWYVPMIIGIYLFIPAVGIALKHLDTRYCFIIGGFTFLYIFIPPTLNPIFISMKISFQLTAILDLSFSGGRYGLYILMRYIAYKYGSSGIPVGKKCHFPL